MPHLCGDEVLAVMQLFQLYCAVGTGSLRMLFTRWTKGVR